MAGMSTFTWRHALIPDSTKSPFDSPIPQTHRAFTGVSPVSWKRHNIGGILITIYGVQELPSEARSISCFWLLHGRGDTQDSMGYTAAALLNAWNQRRQQILEHQQKQSNRKQQSPPKALICICFDQRNHGSRLIENHNNVSWKQGNPTHGPDMFNTYCGTASDLSLLITQIPSYLPFTISEHLCGGVSLGGHATWVALMTDPRLTAAMIIVGAPDYVRLMTDRAIRSNVPSTRNVQPRGRNFLGSEDFPPCLVAALKQYDPAGILLRVSDDPRVPPAQADVERLRPIMQKTLAGKKIICLSGAKDRLVPYAQSEPFLTWLKTAIDEDKGWFRGHGVVLEDIVDQESGHEFSKSMRKEAERWLCDLLAADDEQPPTASRDSKL